MDWTNFTFVVGTVVAMLLKNFVFKGDTVKRDKWLPIIVFVSNFLARVGQDLAGIEPNVPGAGAMMGGGGLMLASIWAYEPVRLVTVSLFDWVMSMGTHRAKRWRDAMVTPEPPTRRRR